jgi:hypothetical protein
MRGHLWSTSLTMLNIGVASLLSPMHTRRQQSWRGGGCRYRDSECRGECAHPLSAHSSALSTPLPPPYAPQTDDALFLQLIARSIRHDFLQRDDCAREDEFDRPLVAPRLLDRLRGVQRHVRVDRAHHRKQCTIGIGGILLMPTAVYDDGVHSCECVRGRRHEECVEEGAADSEVRCADVSDSFNAADDIDERSVTIEGAATDPLMDVVRPPVAVTDAMRIVQNHARTVAAAGAVEALDH